MLKHVGAIATTVRIEPGTEERDDNGVHIRKRTFTDRVESPELALDGTNRVTIDVDIDRGGRGTLRGAFELRLTSGDGGWKGELEGWFEEGLVVAEGIGRGNGAHAGGVVRIDYRQIAADPAKAPIEAPLAVFDMSAVILTGD
jgi:hypothetical protein